MVIIHGLTIVVLFLYGTTTGVMTVAVVGTGGAVAERIRLFKVPTCHSNRYKELTFLVKHGLNVTALTSMFEEVVVLQIVHIG
jgi:hypothetical protein